VEGSAWLPVLGVVGGGGAAGIEEHARDYFPVHEEAAGKADFVLRVEGDSLHPFIQEGDWIAIRRTEEAAEGQLVVASVGGEQVVKRFNRSGGTVCLRSENPNYAPMEVPSGQVRITGVVVWVHRDLTES
jgi:repressor LexA